MNPISATTSLNLPSEATKTISQNASASSKKKTKKIDSATIEKIKDLAQQIKDRKISQKDAVDKSGLPRTSFARLCAKLEKGIDPFEEKAPKKVDDAMVAKVKALLLPLKEKKLSQMEAALQCGIAESTFFSIRQKLEKGQDPTKKKMTPRGKDITDKQVVQVEEILPDIDAKKISVKAAAEKCKIPLSTFNRIVDKLRNGIDPSVKKTPLKVTEKIVEKIKKLIPKIEQGKLSENEAAEQVNLSHRVFLENVKKLKKGEDPLLKKKVDLTPETIKKVKELVPQILSGQLTKKEVMDTYKISRHKLSVIIEEVSKVNKKS